MNFSQSSSIDSGNDCKSFFDETVPLRYSSSESFYVLLVAAAVLSLAACPFTILLNALVMVAVKTKRRLQTHPNILLACLALTDLMIGLAVQPLHITMTIFLLQGKDFHEFCKIDFAFTISYVMSSLASFFHLFLISGERYLAVKHGFSHPNVVTKTRLMLSSAVAWVAAPFLLFVAPYARVVAFGFITAILSSIIVLQILVYKEARRHEQQILSLQTSEEAREKFKKEMKALKLTTIILVTLFLCYFLPGVIMLVTWQLLKQSFSPDIKTLVRHFSVLPWIINSVLNPVIYTVRKREFRVAFIELIIKKSLQEAEEFERRLFRSTNDAVGQQDGQEGEGQGQNAEETNQVHADDNQEDSPEVITSGANFHDNNTLATQNEPVFLNTQNSTSKKTEKEHGEGRNAVLANDELQDDPEVLISDTSFPDNTNLAIQNELEFSNALNDTTKKIKKEDGDGRNPIYANDHLKGNPEGLASGSNFDGTKNGPVFSSAIKSKSQKAKEEPGDRRNPAHPKNKREYEPEVLAAGDNFDDNYNRATQNEPVSSSALNNTSKNKEEKDGEARNPAHPKDKDSEYLVSGTKGVLESIETAQNENFSSNERTQHNES